MVQETITPEKAGDLPDALKGKEVTINMDDMKNILSSIVGPEMQGLKEKMLEVERKAIFPGADDGEAETATKSIIDTSFFSKDFPGQGWGGEQNGLSVSRRFRARGGPFIKLSPALEKFAEVLRYRGDPIAVEAKAGFSMKEYNAEIAEQNAAILGTKALTTTDAGALVPVEYLATIVEFATAQSEILPKLWRIPMGSLSMKIPQLVQAAGSYFGGITLYHPDEGGLKTETKPSFDTLTLTAKKLIGLINITDELVADSSVNILNYCTTLLTRAFRYVTEGEVIAGSGAGNCMLGIKNDPGINVVARTGAGTVVYADLINLESALDENFIDLTFLSRRATVNTLRKQVDTVGQPVYHDGFTTFLGGKMVAQLLGYPVHKTRNVPIMGVKGDIILGDLSYYIWAVRQDMTITQSIEHRFAYDETTLRAVMRQDGLPGVPEAFAVLDGTVS